jgi:quercetin dioxygenase-like cupin family protein
MTYTGESGEISGRFRPAGDVETSVLGAGTRARYIATGDLTNGEFGMFEWDMPDGAGGTAGHFHKTFSESFYVTAGTVRFYNGEQWIDAVAGDFYYVAPGGIHAYHNASGARARMLVLFAPGAPRENYFRELASIGAEGRELSYDEWTALFARHDQYRA